MHPFASASRPRVTRAAFFFSLGTLLSTSVANAQTAQSAAPNTTKSANVDTGSTSRTPDERLAPTTLRARDWYLGIYARAGESNGGSTTQKYFTTSLLYPSVALGITDRLMVNLTHLGVAYRFGERGGLEIVPSLRSGFQLWLGGIEGKGVVFYPSLAVDARVWLASKTALTAGVSVLSRIGHIGAGDCSVSATYCAPRDYVFDQFGFTASVGLTHTQWDRVTLTPTVGIDTGATESDFADPWLTAFGRANRGVWDDPLLRIHLAPWVALDGDLTLALRPSDERFYFSGGGGFSFSW